ncbi:MAG: S8 family serine peptidase [Puniceicoccaceae bacterium]|nr:S8 family serine peptidase [Puniceicoccaceae bacterium]
MKSQRLPWILLGLALFGALIGFFLSTERSLSFFSETDAKIELEASDLAAQVDSDFPVRSNDQVGIQDLAYPSNAIPGELVFHFDSRQDYLAYLKALTNAGIAPLGQIDELLALRISERALLQANLAQSVARASYSYRIERPLPPVEIDPEALANLRHYGLSARAITGGIVAGQGEGVIVAILDSGIQAHSQFDDIYIAPIDLVDCGVAGRGAAHGTSVASIITGREGIAPAAELFVVRVLDDEGLGNSYDVAQGIVQAVDLGVQIINMSLGVYQDAALLRQAIKYADDRGVIMVAAAGNDGYNRMPYPAAYPQVLSVTAVDAGGQHANFSNQSKEIDFAAPGVGVLTAKEDKGTTLFSGTSAAAPFVSGTIASLISGDDALSPKQAVEALKRYLNDQGPPSADPVYGAGLVDWDRLRERATPNLLDVALADIYLQPDAQPGNTMPIEVTVQNRGTKWFSDAQLEIFVGEAKPISFILGSLGPGQTTTRKVFTQIPPLDSDETLSLAARVMPKKVEDDIRLDNNLKAVTFRSAK